MIFEAIKFAAKPHSGQVSNQIGAKLIFKLYELAGSYRVKWAQDMVWGKVFCGSS